MLLHQAVSEQTRVRPHSVALIDVGRSRSITFAQLIEHLNALAANINAAGAPPNAAVGLCAEANWMSVVAVLSVSHARCAYVPLDPSYPAERLRYMADDSSICLLVRVMGEQTNVVGGTNPLSWFEGRILDVSVTSDMPPPRAVASASDGSAHSQGVAVRPPAYILYTSGSSGRPKGVIGSHHAMLQRLQASLARYPYSSDEIGCHKTSLNFVDSVCEVLLPLSSGGGLPHFFHARRRTQTLCRKR